MLQRVFETPALTLDGEHYMQYSEINVDRVANYITVSYIPRSDLTAGVVAKADNAIRVPPQTGGKRWTRRKGWPGQGTTPYDIGGGVTETVLTPAAGIHPLPYVNPANGRFMAARNIIMPERGTDFTLNEEADGSGSFDYTVSEPQRVTLSMVESGSGLDITFTNTAIGNLYVRDFQVRGTGIVNYDAEQIIRADETSLGLYGQRMYTYRIPLDSGRIFAEAVAHYLLSRFKTPSTETDVVDLGYMDKVGAVNLFGLEIGDVIALSEDQTGISAHKLLIMGMAYDIPQGGRAPSVQLFTRRISDQTYWILGDSTYGVLGETTRLGI